MIGEDRIEITDNQGPAMSGRPCRVIRQGDLTRQLDMEEKSRHPLPDMNKELTTHEWANIQYAFIISILTKCCSTRIGKKTSSEREKMFSKNGAVFCILENIRH